MIFTLLQPRGPGEWRFQPHYLDGTLASSLCHPVPPQWVRVFLLSLFSEESKRKTPLLLIS